MIKDFLQNFPSNDRSRQIGLFVSVTIVRHTFYLNDAITCVCFMFILSIFSEFEMELVIYFVHRRMW